MATTAVSFRKGNTEENTAFAGVAGEIVADLGANSQDSSQATIVLHTGSGLAGGIRMAREDMNNITTESINNLANFQYNDGGATSYGLARRNLSNYVTNNVNAETVEPKLKTDYKIASRDASDIDTTNLTGPDGNLGTNDAPGGGLRVATRTLSNLHTDGENKVKRLSYSYWLDTVNTDYLATTNGTEYPVGSGVMHDRGGGKNLAYADMSNVNTASLAELDPTDPHLGKNLAYWDLTNVGYQTIVDYIDDAYDVGDVKLQNYEWVDNKITSIDPYGDELITKYTSAKSVVDYCSTVSQNYANIKLDNVVDWRIASEKVDLYKINVDIEDGGLGYATTGGTSSITTNIPHPDGSGYIVIKVRKVNADGKILEASLADDKLYGPTPLSSSIYTDPNMTNGATFTLYTASEEIGGTTVYTPVYAGKLMLANLDNSQISNVSGTNTSKITYGRTEDGSGNITSIDSLEGSLFDSTTNTIATFSVDKEVDGVEARLLSSDRSSSATVSQTTGTSLSDLAVIVATFESQFTNPASGLYAFTSDGTNWSYNGNTVTISNYGITYSGTPVNGDEITVSYATEKISSVIVAKDNAYLNKDEPVEVLDANHELLNRGEIVSYVTNEIQDAIQTVISTAVVFKGVVADETLLPTTGNTNGDLWWITAFSANPPAGMVEGRSGSAIWNENLTPADWSYEQDNQNVPDNITLEYHTTASAQVMSVKRAGAHNGKANALVIESDGLYVKTPVEVPELPVLSQQIAIAQTSGTSLSNLEVTQATFESLISTAGSYVFSFDGTDWSLNSTTVDITDYGISYTGTPVSGDAITVTINDSAGVYHLYAQNINGTMQYSWVNDALLAVTTQNS